MKPRLSLLAVPGGKDWPENGPSSWVFQLTDPLFKVAQAALSVFGDD